MTGAQAPSGGNATPTVWRRLMCLVYEGVVLFGVVMMAGYLYSSLTQQRHALIGTAGLQVFLFVVLAIYFVWFWTHGGQTVAMKAWQIRLVTVRGDSVTQARALARYFLGWMWFVPALAIVHFAGLKGLLPLAVTLSAGVLAFAALSRLHPERQFWHDVICGTRLVIWRPTPDSKTH